MHTLVIVIAKYFVFLAPVVWLIVLARIPKGQRVRFIIFSAVSAALTALFVKIGTTVHQDPRPFIRDHVHPYFSSSTDNGFPSDHTAFSGVIALVVLRYNRWVGAALVVLSISIGTARVISGIHHGQDIVGGFVFAIAGTALAWGAEVLYQKYVRPASKH